MIYRVGLGADRFNLLVCVLIQELYLAATGHSSSPVLWLTILEQKTAEGLNGSALEVETPSLAELETHYQSLTFRIPLTFLEIFPVGLIVALISSALLRNPKFAPQRA